MRTAEQGTKKYEVDHIFPRGKLGDEEFLRENGVEPDQIDWFKDNRDHIANLQLLGPKENQSKSDRDLNDWLDRIDNGYVGSLSDREEYFDQHRVPEDPNLHEYQNYPEFVEYRLDRMKGQLETELPLKETL